MSKRRSWKTQRNTYNAITRELAALAARPAIHTCERPPDPPLTRRGRKIAAEKERLRERVRAALAEESQG